MPVRRLLPLHGRCRSPPGDPKFGLTGFQVMCIRYITFCGQALKRESYDSFAPRTASGAIVAPREPRQVARD